ncbi:hypothetical protein MED134_05439 [Dokdonia sp. MED134]|uniref:GEVED domain-containing protein n=1 Tax=Dokdonia sp. MED134 TaxID=313590 RepID=UPI000068AAA5|nr:GEVED domain-containing protein [Dokdonia sp. MED134]EAQ40171.1 hypothetical protein MED134_05439 [Dokdonia sp. MED134]
MIRKLLAISLLVMSMSVFAQETQPVSTVGTGTYLGKTEPLRDFPTLSSSPSYGFSELNIVENNFGVSPGASENALPLNGDPIGQRTMGENMSYAPIVNFDGANASEGQATPPDPSGAVGPNHYVQGVNLVIKIYDKTGNLLAGPTSLGEFLGNGANNGDPIIMYDHLADRWFVSQFQTSNNALIIGISETPDPTGAYFLYEYPLDSFPDYPHYAIWPDAYYLTSNKSGATTYALDRDALLAGEANPAIQGFNLPGVIANPNTVFSPEPANLTGFSFPQGDVPGYIVYLQDDGWGAAFDHLKVWELDIDFDNSANSTVSAPLEIPTAPFDSFLAPFGAGELNQPGTTNKIDMLSGIISYAANYRTFEDHNSWLITFNVDVNSDNTTSGIRWIELRNSDTEPWSIFQEGTYAPDDGNSRFMGSGAMDAQGNIGLAFNVGGPDQEVGISYTGRFDGDAPGEMTAAEQIIVEGGGIQSNTNRFGDYSHLTMDPDNFTFWHTSEYFSADNFWNTRIASFNLSAGFETDLGVLSIVTPEDGALTNAETVEVTVRNFGTVAQSDIPVTLTLDGVEIANEVIAGPIEPGTAINYTFTATADMSTEGQTYILEATTGLSGDQAAVNDSAIKEVMHLFMVDVGVTALVTPVDASGLTDVETITVDITNFGSQDQTGFPVQYTINGSTPIVETYTETLAAASTASFSFATTADLSSIGSYDFVIETALPGDQVVANDAFSATIENQVCLPNALSGCNVDGIKQFILNTISADDGADGCNTEPDGSPAGYADRTDLSTELSNLAGSNVYTLRARQNWGGGAGVEALSVWIDFNDNGGFEPEEQLIAGEFFQSSNVLEDFTLTIPEGAALGSHRLRAKAIDTSANGDINNPCSDFSFGEVQDYTVVITDQLQTADIGVVAITAPESGVELGNQDVTIEMSNFGSLEQIDFDVQYTVNGGTPVVETIDTAIGPGSSISYTFSQQADLSEITTYDIEARTLLASDSNGTNNAATTTVESTLTVDDLSVDFSDLTVTKLENNNFDVMLTTNFDGRVYVGLSNILGQQLKYKPIAKDVNGYRVNLDLSSLSSGIYVIKVNDLRGNFVKTAKILVE